MNTSDNTQTDSPRPLHFWLHEVDSRLADEFADACRAAGITPREAHALRMLSDRQQRPDDDPRRGKKLRRLAERGWAVETDGDWSLTDAGREAAERIAAAFAGIRSRIADAAPADDLATTVATLEAIARGLGWDESQPTRSPRRPGSRRGRSARHGSVDDASGRRCGRGARGHRGHGHDDGTDREAHGHRGGRPHGGRGAHRSDGQQHARGDAAQSGHHAH
ncbi:hypothetical protein [Microbacterium sp.]|uniref:hypothetical protein n=1 Tax=Microbacterium sp. TaxID=51671 RepID=UPI003A8A5736